MTNSLRTLLTDLIDYAGLFPPAKLPMQASVEAYQRCLMSEESWMLGRFVVPVSRLDEFEAAARALLPGTAATSGYRERVGAEPWRLTVLMDQAPEAGITRIEQFNEAHQHEEEGLALIDMTEIKVAKVDEIDAWLDELPEDLFPFFEFAVDADCRGFVTALAGEPAAAKIRTGGVQAGAFPMAREVAEFLTACVAANVPFKATAGLHHPVRGHYRLTYDANAPTAVMYGFLNVFMAAALAKVKGLPADEIEEILTEEEPASFKFMDNVAAWRSHGIDTAQLAMVREGLALSFGSCSFDEPVEDLRRMGLL